jgi:DNA polymerase-3 subunit delta
MVAVKSNLVDSFLKNLKEDICAYLVHGTDEGRISETAAQIARDWSKRFGDNGEIIQLDERALGEHPDSLAVELRSVPMFGGRTVIRTSAAGKVKPDDIEELLAAPLANLLVIEAGNLATTSALRKLFEKAPNAAAIGCYPDEGRDIARLIDEELVSKGIALTGEARKLLTASLGGDRGVTRMELMKLALYAFDKPNIDVEDVVAAIGDSSQLAYDGLIAQVLAGQTAEALTKLERLAAAGQSASGFTTMLGRHLLQLYKLRVMVDSGRSAIDAVGALRPPVHFRQKDAMAHQVTRFNVAMLKKAVQLVQESVRQSRLNAQLESINTERLVIILSRMAARSSH